MKIVCKSHVDPVEVDVRDNNKKTMPVSRLCGVYATGLIFRQNRRNVP